MTGELTALVEGLRAYGVDPARVELDLGFGRGIGFYSQMIFVLMVVAPTPDAPCPKSAAEGSYDGLARVLGSPIATIGGVGFAFGLERVRDAVLRAQGRSKGAEIQDRLLIIPGQEDALPHAIRLAIMLRNRGTRAIIEPNLTLDLIDSRGFGMNAKPVRSGRRTILERRPLAALAASRPLRTRIRRQRMKLKELIKFYEERSGTPPRRRTCLSVRPRLVSESGEQPS